MNGEMDSAESLLEMSRVSSPPQDSDSLIDSIKKLKDEEKVEAYKGSSYSVIVWQCDSLSPKLLRAEPSGH